MSIDHDLAFLGDTPWEARSLAAVTRPVEDWWMVGMRTLACTRFEAAIFPLDDQPPLTLEEATTLLASLPPGTAGLSVRVSPESGGRFSLFPVICFPHPEQKGCRISLRISYDRYLEGLRHSGRRRFQLAIRKYRAVNGGEVDFREYRTPEECREFAELACKVSTKTYQWRENRIGVRNDPRELAGLRADAARDGFRGYILFAQGEPIAYFVGYGVGDVLHGDRIGYDPSFRHVHPGFALLENVLRSVFQDRFESLDLGPEGFDYKAALATESYSYRDVFYLRSTPKWVVWAVARRGFSAFTRMLSRVRAAIRSTP